VHCEYATPKPDLNHFNKGGTQPGCDVCTWKYHSETPHNHYTLIKKLRKKKKKRPPAYKPCAAVFAPSRPASLPPPSTSPPGDTPRLWTGLSSPASGTQGEATIGSVNRTCQALLPCLQPSSKDGKQFLCHVHKKYCD
jgi:hypothetical protein